LLKSYTKPGYGVDLACGLDSLSEVSVKCLLSGQGLFSIWDFTLLASLWWMSRGWQEDMRLPGQRTKDFITCRRQHGLHVLIGFPCPPNPMEANAEWIQVDVTLTVSLNHSWGVLNLENLSFYKITAIKSAPTLPRKEAFFIILVRKQICPFSWKATLYLPKAADYTNILGKIVKDKSCHKIWRHVIECCLLAPPMFKRTLSWLEFKCFHLWKHCPSLRSPVILSPRVVPLPVVVLPGFKGSSLCLCILIFKQTFKMTLIQISGALSLHIFLLSDTLLLKL